VIPVTAFVGFVLVATAMTFRDRRLGIFFIIVVGALQDPVRKITPDTPAILVLSSLPIWFAMGHQLLRGGWRSFSQTFPQLSWAMRLFMISLPLPVFITLAYGAAAWRLAAIGLFGYLAPLAGIVLGFVYARRVKDVERLLTFYCLVTCVSLVGGPIEYLGLAQGQPAIGTEVLGAVWVRTGVDTALNLISGFYRSPDIMGWHAATVVMLGLTVALHRRYRRSSWLLTAAGFGVVCLLLSGRRKMLMMPAVWASLVILYWLRTGRASRVVTLLLAGFATAAAVYYASGEIGIEQGYFEYAASSAREGRARVIEGSWGAVMTTIAQSGILGGGIGVATQGAQHLDLGRLQSWQESGPSRIMVELGVPGFVCAIVLLFAVARACARRLAEPSGAASLALGLMAFAAANAACFAVSHQVYGDVVILTLASFGLGLALSAPEWSGISEKRPLRPHVLAEHWQPRRASPRGED